MEDERRRFLQFFEQPRQSQVSNEFLRVVRRSPGLDALHVARDVWDALDLRARDPREDPSTALKLRRICDLMKENREAAIEFAAWAISWEELPAEERLRRNAERSKAYAKAYLEKKRGEQS